MTIEHNELGRFLEVSEAICSRHKVPDNHETYSGIARNMAVLELVVDGLISDSKNLTPQKCEQIERIVNAVLDCFYELAYKLDGAKGMVALSEIMDASSNSIDKIIEGVKK